MRISPAEGPVSLPVWMCAQLGSWSEDVELLSGCQHRVGELPGRVLALDDVGLRISGGCGVVLENLQSGAAADVGEPVPGRQSVVQVGVVEFDPGGLTSDANLFLCARRLWG